MNKRAFCLSALLLALCATSASARGSDARALHQSLLTLDTHLDTPANLDLPGWRIDEEHDVHADFTQVDLPRMKKGGLDGGFWAIYTPQGPLDPDHYAQARDFAVMRGGAIREMALTHPKDFALATRADEAEAIAASHRRIVYMSMENAYPLGEDISLLRLFDRMGLRMLGFAHFGNNQFADSSTDPKGPRWHGLSPLGVALLREANRLGMIIDASHSSDEALDQMLALSTTPVILSHSGCKAVFDHPRNVDDARIRAVAANGGVIQINSFGAYLRKPTAPPEKRAALAALRQQFPEEGMTEAQYRDFLAQRKAIDARYPEADPPTIDDVMRHLFHALKLVGPDHVGIGLDWDGGGGVQGMKDVSAIPEITRRLSEAGYSRTDIAKIWGGNVLRVLRAAEAASDRSTVTP